MILMPKCIILMKNSVLFQQPILQKDGTSDSVTKMPYNFVLRCVCVCVIHLWSSAGHLASHSVFVDVLLRLLHFHRDVSLVHSFIIRFVSYDDTITY